MRLRFLLPIGFLISLQSPAPALASSRPANILFIAVDDLNTDLGSYGHPLAQTPHLDRLAARSRQFDRAYCQFPHCAPSRASLLTGRRPDEIGAHTPGSAMRFLEAAPDAVTLPRYLRTLGFATARVGKIFHQGVPGGIGEAGVDDPGAWEIALNPRGRDKDDEARLVNFTPRRPLGSALALLAADGTDEEQTDGQVATEAIRLLEELRARPFFLAVGFYRPHCPYVAPKPYFDRYPLETIPAPVADEAELAALPPAALWTKPAFWGLGELERRRVVQGYYAAVTFMDAQVGRVLDALERLGLAENTLVVFWGDHGYLLGEHGQWMKNSLFEPALRAPLLIGGPGVGAPGRSASPVEFVDVYPTVLDLLGLPAPGPLSGRTLRPLLENAEAPWPHVAYSQVNDGRSVRTRRWRYSEWGENGRDGMMLHDHDRDRGERTNLAHEPEFAHVRTELQAVLRAHFGPYRAVVKDVRPD